MKPKRIFLVRHGQSQGNVDRSVYGQIPDYAVQLTPEGVIQAYKAGIDIGKVLLLKKSNPTFQFYVSPYWRTRQTFSQLKLGLENVFDKIEYKVYEDPRLREQEWCQQLQSRLDLKQVESERDSFGTFYYRFNGAESCADVFDRVSDFMGTLFRDFEKDDYPENTIVVIHGMTVRLFLMRWFHCSVEEFESWANPLNGSHFELELGNDGKYKLLTPVRVYKTVGHSYQMWNPLTDRKLTNIIVKD